MTPIDFAWVQGKRRLPPKRGADRFRPHVKVKPKPHQRC